MTKGARISHRAETPDVPRYFNPTTVLADVPADAAIMREEIFGPVAPVTVWTDEDDLIWLVNDTEFGLAAYVFAGDLGRALRLGERIEAGTVGINRGLASDPSCSVRRTEAEGPGP